MLNLLRLQILECASLISKLDCLGRSFIFSSAVSILHESHLRVILR